MVGPVQITIGTNTAQADAIPVVVFPDPGTNDYFEVRIVDTEIQKKEAVEVVVQWRRLKRVSNPYAKAEPAETHPFHLTKVAKTDDWELRPKRWNSLGGSSGQDNKGPYIIEGRTEVYEFVPRKSGSLPITADLFRNLPADYRFEPKTIAVKD